MSQKIILHRGNTNGPNPELENHPEQIQHCIDLNYDVEIDLRLIDERLWLGHDEPQYEITSGWIHMRSNYLWIHCKNVEALCYLQQHPWSEDLNYFWHQDDSYTVTSKNFIWAYPGKFVPKPLKSVCVMPELVERQENLSEYYAICSDYMKL